MDSSASFFGQVSFPFKGYQVCFSLFITEIPVFNANSVDPGQTTRSAASDLSIHGLPMSLLWDARQKWVKFSKQTDV